MLQCDALTVGAEPVLAHFALKLVLNAVSTCANVIRGVVHGNTMINLTVSNNKLFHRAADIVAHLAHCDVATAQGEREGGRERKRQRVGTSNIFLPPQNHCSKLRTRWMS